VRLLVTVFLFSTWLPSQNRIAATISGTVVDESGNPIKDARIDHIGKRVVVVASSVVVPPSSDEIRTDAEGHFKATTTKPAMIIRKAGYESQRVFVTGDAQLQITLHSIKPLTCKVEHIPKVKTKQANDVDFTATWYYIKTKNGPRGILSGEGGTYSWGAPSDSDVWTSLDYFEVMYESGVVDARGHTADGKYWRSQSILGRSAQYFGVDQTTAEILDCIMNRVLVKTP